MDSYCRQSGLEVLRLREELERAQRKVQPGIARPVRPGSKARAVPQSPAEREAESIRMRLHVAEVQYQQQGCTEEYLQLLADELAQEE